MEPSVGNLPIVVGVDDSPGSWVALAWAVEEAGRRGASLNVVHAWHPTYEPDVEENQDAALSGARLTHGDTILTKSLRWAREAAPELDMSGSLIKGRPSAALLGTSQGAAMLVVGPRGTGGFAGLRLGSVSVHLVAHALCPVVIVRGVSPWIGPVVVGVDWPASAESEAALEAGFEAAALRRAPLRVMWVAPAGEQAGADEIAELVAGWNNKYPSVQVATETRVGHAAEALVEASDAAQLLIVGSHGSGGFVGMSLGSVAHAVVQHGHCPVMVMREKEVSA